MRYGKQLYKTGRRAIGQGRMLEIGTTEKRKGTSRVKNQEVD